MNQEDGVQFDGSSQQTDAKKLRQTISEAFISILVSRAENFPLQLKFADSKIVGIKSMTYV